MKNYKIIFLVLLFGLPFSLAGQKKYEREYNLVKEKVPAKAKAFIDSCCRNSKVKWYGEESFKGKSIEAKLKHKGALFSIEFNTSGYIQDVEKKIGINNIPKTARLAIANNLDSVFSKHKIDKIQVQWIGSNQALYDLIEKDSSRLPHTLNYELVVMGKIGKSTRIYELQFNIKGGILTVSEIVRRNTDNLDY